MKPRAIGLRTIGAELILTMMVLPFAVWIVTSIFELRADYSDVLQMREDIKIIKTCLINGECRDGNKQ